MELQKEFTYNIFPGFRIPVVETWSVCMTKVKTNMGHPLYKNKTTPKVMSKIVTETATSKSSQ